MLIKRKSKTENYDSRMSETSYKTIYNALSSILNTEVKKKGDNGVEVPDWVMTVSAMRMKARIALDFVNNLDKKVVKENK